MNNTPDVQPATSAVIPGQHVVLTGTSARVRIPAQGTAAAPIVDLVREGDVIRAIDVTCVCGSKLRLVCDYE